MSLKPGYQDAYKERHNPIWSDLQDVLKRHGARNYSIFLDRRTDKLFAYVEVESEERWQKIAETEACRRWWDFMKEVMLTNPDSSPVAVDLEEVFHLD